MSTNRFTLRVFIFFATGIALLHPTHPSLAIRPHHPNIAPQAINPTAPRPPNASANSYFIYLPDISRPPEQLIKVSEFPIPGIVEDVALTGNMVFALAYYASDQRSHVLALDATDPANLRKVGEISFTGYASELVVKDSIAYVASGNPLLRVINVAVPSNLQLMSSLGESGSSSVDIVVRNNKAYMTAFNTAGSRVLVVNIQNPSTPVLVGSKTTISGDIFAGGVAITGTTLYKGETTSTSTRERVQIYDVANDTSPAFLSDILLPGGGGVRTIEIVGSYAYFAEFDRGLQIYSLGNAPQSPILAGTYGPCLSCKTLAVSQHYVYLDTNDSIEAISVANPAQPKRTAAYTDTVVSANGMALQNNYIFVADYNQRVLVLKHSF